MHQVITDPSGLYLCVLINDNTVSMIELATGVKVYDYVLPFSYIGSYMISNTSQEIIITDKNKATV